MRLKHSFWSAVTVITALVYCMQLTAGEIKLSQQNFYAGEKCQLTIILPQTSNTPSSLYWTINSLGAEISRGNTTMAKNGTFELKFTAPTLKPEISVKAELVCKNIPGTPTAPLFFRSAEIFTQQTAAKALKINILQIGDDNNPLITTFESHKIPFKKICGTEEFDGQTLIICGMDFDENFELAKTLNGLAAQGKKIILLPPLKGHFPAGNRQFDQIVLGKSTEIKTFNRDFDLPLADGSFTASAWDELFVLACSNRTDGFSCGVLKTGTGMIIITTWDLLKLQKTNPSAWYLLKQWLFL